MHLEGKDHVLDFIFSQHSAWQKKHSLDMTDLLGISWIFLYLYEQKLE